MLSLVNKGSQIAALFKHLHVDVARQRQRQLLDGPRAGNVAQAVAACHLVLRLGGSDWYLGGERVGHTVDGDTNGDGDGRLTCRAVGQVLYGTQFTPAVHDYHLSVLEGNVVGGEDSLAVSGDNFKHGLAALGDGKTLQYGTVRRCYSGAA